MSDKLDTAIELGKQIIEDSNAGDLVRGITANVLGLGYLARNTWYTPDADDNFKRASDEALKTVGLYDKYAKSYKKVMDNGGKAVGVGGDVEDSVALAQGMTPYERPEEAPVQDTDSGDGSAPTTPTVTPTPETTTPPTSTTGKRAMPIFGDIEDTDLKNTDVAVLS